MTAVPQWQARLVHLYGGKPPTVLSAALQETSARLALAEALNAESTARLVLAGRIWESNRVAAMAEMRLHKAFSAAAESVTLGATSVEIVDNRWELIHVTEDMSTPTSTE